MVSPAPSFAPESGQPARLPPERAAALLAGLRQAHQNLLGAIGALEELTSQPEPDAGRYPGARWRLSLASRKRRQLVAEAAAALLPALPPHEAGSINRLQGQQADRLRESAAHVHAWTTPRIAADWRGYCAASAQVRAAMRRRITAEQAALYPLLERFARRG